MNLTLAVDDRIVDEARKVASSMGKSLNQLVRDYLEGVAAQGLAEAEIAELRAISLESGGRSRGWRFDREEIHERP
ncbi:MAG TPA: DUF6364 family protein [Thermoanaerobaculia bacterium]|nr:DUF6364 family protein [Thermoanaerobaculia bacterium]